MTNFQPVVRGQEYFTIRPLVFVNIYFLKNRKLQPMQHCSLTSLLPLHHFAQINEEQATRLKWTLVLLHNIYILFLNRYQFLEIVSMPPHAKLEVWWQIIHIISTFYFFFNNIYVPLKRTYIIKDVVYCMRSNASALTSFSNLFSYLCTFFCQIALHL